ncbi:MAG: 3-oxoacyl-[acyl-carrier-protein] synthase III C-terminal domain-containing protein [Allobranchiibius sp.]
MTVQILSARGALPPHRYPQEQITDAFVQSMVPGTDERLTRRFHGNAGVDYRHTAIPLEQYSELTDFGASNDIFIDVAVQLGSQAVLEALKAAGLEPRDLDVIISATVTGLAVPSLDARIAANIGLRPDVVRMPLVGLGCVAGAAGVARLDDFLRGRPDAVGVLVAVELCSLTLQRTDRSLPNLVASGLFGDGAGAVVAAGSRRAAALADPITREPVQPRILATRSHLYPDSERTMGFDVRSTGLQIVLDANVPNVVREYLGDDVDAFLADHGLTRADIGWYVAHPGGPKVLEAMQDTLGLEREALAVTWDSLARVGNMSSVSVLHVLMDTLADRPPKPDTYGLMIAMGPGFCSELVLLQAPGTAETPDSSETADAAAAPA